MGILRFRLSGTIDREREGPRADLISRELSWPIDMGINSREQANDRLSHFFNSHITYPYLPASISLTTTVPYRTALPYHTIPPSLR